MGVDIKGLQGLTERLNGMVKIDAMEKAITDAVLFLEGEAKKKAPKSIQPTISSEAEGLEGKVFTNLFYAPYVEYGTGTKSEHPDGGRKDVPWVFVIGSEPRENTVKKKYTLAQAKQAVAIMKDKGIDGATYTFGQAAQPFMRPALDENREKVIEILGRGLLKK